jgi:hypothetical protein
MLDRNNLARGRALGAALAALGVLAITPAIAQAGVGAASTPSFPPIITVGQVGVTGKVTVRNNNDGSQSSGINRVCNPLDAAPCGGSAERGIVLTPSCHNLSPGTGCTALGADPGVFSLSATGVGSAGSCVGLPFTIARIDSTFDTYSFTPVPSTTHVSLSGFGASCEITFTFDVLKSPIDQDPSTHGVQTAQVTNNSQCLEGCAVGGLPAQGLGTDNGTTVLRAGPPAITTVASNNVNVGGQLTDQATVSGLVSPVAGASVTFRLYPPSSPSCTAGTDVFTDSQVVTLAGGVATATSAAYTPTAAGVYHWVATYGGDANNLPISGTCGEATETRTVSPPGTTPPPTVVCTPPPGPAPPGGKLCTTPPACTTPPGPAPAGGVLCAKGTAAIRGRTGCEGNPFKVVVTGRQIESVTFAMDGKVIRRLTKPNSASRYSLAVNPRKLRLGVHRVVARTIFRKQSGTKARTLRVTFSKCARSARSPAFTG